MPRLIRRVGGRAVGVDGSQHLARVAVLRELRDVPGWACLRPNVQRRARGGRLTTRRCVATQTSRSSSQERAADGRATHAISCSKGPLVLEGLERRVGQPAMVAALKRLVSDRTGQFSTWDDVVAAVRASAGEDVGQSLRVQLTQKYLTFD